MFGVIGALAALTEPGAPASGQEVDVAIYEAVAALMESSMADLELGGVLRGRSGSTLPGVAPSNVYPTADGSEVVIAANADSVFARLCEAMGQPELAHRRALRHPRRAGRATWPSSTSGSAAWTATLPAAELLERLEAHGVPAGQIFTAREMLADPHYLAREMVQRHLSYQGWEVPMTGVVPRFTPHARRGAPHRAAPRRTTPRPCCARWPGCTQDELDELDEGRVDLMVLVRDVSLRDGLQDETAVPTEAKLALFDALVAAGVAEMELTSFVRPDRVPAMADAEAVVAADRRRRPAWCAGAWCSTGAAPSGRMAGRAPAPAVRLLGVRGPQPGERRAGRVAASLGELAEIAALARTAGAVTEVVLATAFGCPFTGPVPAGDVQRAAEVALGAGIVGIAPGRHDRHRRADRGSGAGRGGPLDRRRHPGRRPPPRHPRPGPGQRPDRHGRRGGAGRRRRRRPRRLPVRPGRIGQPRHRGPRACASRRWGSTPASTSTSSSTPPGWPAIWSGGG